MILWSKRNQSKFMQTNWLKQIQSLKCRPGALSLPFVHHILDAVVVEFGVLKFVANDRLELVIGEPDNVFLQRVLVHVRTQSAVGDRRLGIGDHLGPAGNMLFVDLLYVVQNADHRAFDQVEEFKCGPEERCQHFTDAQQRAVGVVHLLNRDCQGKAHIQPRNDLHSRG